MMLKSETHITTIITMTKEQRDENYKRLESAIAALERALVNKHGYTEVPTVCPILAEYIVAKALEERERDKYSVMPLIEKAIWFGTMCGETQWCRCQDGLGHGGVQPNHTC